MNFKKAKFLVVENCFFSSLNSIVVSVGFLFSRSKKGFLKKSTRFNRDQARPRGGISPRRDIFFSRITENPMSQPISDRLLWRRRNRQMPKTKTGILTDLWEEVFFLLFLRNFSQCWAFLSFVFSNKYSKV